MPKLTKKSQKTTLSIKPESTKKFILTPSHRKSPQDNNKIENVYVEYKTTDTPFRNSVEPLVIDKNPSALFYPSQNCKYHVVN